MHCFGSNSEIHILWIDHKRDFYSPIFLTLLKMLLFPTTGWRWQASKYIGVMWSWSYALAVIVSYRVTRGRMYLCLQFEQGPEWPIDGHKNLSPLPIWQMHRSIFGMETKYFRQNFPPTHTTEQAVYCNSRNFPLCRYLEMHIVVCIATGDGDYSVMSCACYEISKIFYLR